MLVCGPCVVVRGIDFLSRNVDGREVQRFLYFLEHNLLSKEIQ